MGRPAWAKLVAQRAVLQRDDHHVLRTQGLVGHAGGLDDQDVFLPADAGDIAPGKGDQIVAGQLQIGLPHGVFQVFQHRISFLPSA